jgi:DNA-binding XRE family transcriptional regulator
MVDDAPRPMRRLLRYARSALMMTQREMGETIGAASRTIIRWERGHSEPSPDQVKRLADLVRPEEADLADELLAAAGVHVPAPLAPPPERVPLPVPPPVPVAMPKHAVDAVVYAAADAMNVAPRAMRLAIAAAFLRARELGLSIEAVAEALGSEGP